ncbi:mannose-1-phosphate guanylyltransferase [Arachidicoccus soli]|uniref:mannose-1-phosphate guanylyltransferase n=2 Tax=Arachidicoccus soli TaxID=2341117 RepID=A0A386HUY7_9BACT|nr:mannose-1-phosphate guanylyltransferase [Arachidicoccus soli]
MAGGVGSRFWPKSRNSFPKQFIDILGTGKSLLQMTAERFCSFIDKDKIHIVTNKDYNGLVAQQLPYLPMQNIIGEPARNNTAPCIAYAAFKLYQQNPDAIMVIVPSDHLIIKETAYAEKIQQAIDFAKNKDALITLGIQPTRPDTGYGYIQFEEDAISTDIYKVLSFKEKPSKEKAMVYLETGQYLWNAGMFIWKASTIMAAFKELTPEIYHLFVEGQSAYNTEKEAAFIQEKYPLAPNISIDFAIMEKAKNVYTIPADIGWSDLGTWNSLHDVYNEKDENNNAAILKNIYMTNSEGCLINASDSKLVVVNGLKDFIVVDDDNVLLIYPKNKEQEIKETTIQLKNKGLLKFL